MAGPWQMREPKEDIFHLSSLIVLHERQEELIEHGGDDFAWGGRRRGLS
jgi:hypothetical protein